MGAALLAGAVLAAPLLCGSSRPWALAPLLLVAAAASWASGRGRRGLRVDVVVLGAAVLLLATALQAIPLPDAWVRALSPVSYAVQRDALGPLGPSSAWPSLSLAPAATWVEWSKLALLLLVYAAARDVAEHRSRATVVGMVAGAGAAVAVAGLLHAAVDAQAVWGFFRPSGVERVAGPFVNGNHQAGMLALGAAAAVGLALDARSARRRWVWAAAVVLAVAAGLLARSRGGTVAIGLAVCGALAMATVRSSARRLFPVAALLALIVVVALWGDVLLEVFSDRNTLKVDLWRPAPEYFRDFWATGAGRGAFQVVYPRYQVLADARSFTHLENVPLQTALDHGVVGVVLAFAVAAGLLALLWRRTASSLEAAGAVGLAALALHNLVDFNLETAGVAVPATALLGALLARSSAVPASASTRRVPRVALPALALGGALALGAGVQGDMARAEERVREAATRANDEEFAAALRVVLPDHPANHLLPLYAAEREMRRADQGREGRPLPWINRALVLFPASHDAHLFAARVLARAGRTAQAVLEYRLAIDARPAREEPLIGELVRRWPRFDVLRDVANTRVHRLVRWNLLAIKLDRVSTRSEAEHADRALLAEDPGHLEALRRRAWRAHADGRHDEALARAADLEPRDAALAARVRGTVWLAQGRAVDAVRAFERAADAAPHDGQVWLELARAAAAAGDVPRVRAAIDRVRLAAATKADATATDRIAAELLEQAAGVRSAAPHGAPGASGAARP